LSPQVDVASQGSPVDEAQNNLKEALELFFETASPEELSTRSFLERKSAGFLRFTDLKR